MSLSPYLEHKAYCNRRSLSSGDKRATSKSSCSGLRLSPLFVENTAPLGKCGIELVDAETWRISSSVADAWKGRNVESQTNNVSLERVDHNGSIAEDDSSFDKIDDMRVQGKLFFKIDRDSKEYEEYSYDFHRREKPDNKKKNRTENDKKKISNTSKQKEERKEPKQMGNQFMNFDFKHKDIILSNYEMGNFGIEKKVRTPTFNQLTAPYHEPFCLDIYVSKGSVRACIVHRATSNVVAVAHSISKDMKFDYSSKRNATTCAAVGELLAQRALADDIHNVVYTPRKGDKVEGKLQIVLQSIIKNGVSVKVKVKQRKTRRVGHSHPR